MKITKELSKNKHYLATKNLDLKRPIYKQTAAYGHFGRNDLILPWEKLNKVDEIKKHL
ncbi:methionine adenosyltransferase domain-containing protein [Clostridium algoriphilum]|uniref:methionine adenosyltransferase domain-containing protein n=1 Tax=Clostridium algoriphilum TaxID=198347 RepID=UPI00299ED465|nr:methionine adenosyltransferase domain-containing protein [Clostridium algoriphilum]